SQRLPIAEPVAHGDAPETVRVGPRGRRPEEIGVDAVQYYADALLRQELEEVGRLGGRDEDDEVDPRDELPVDDLAEQLGGWWNVAAVRTRAGPNRFSSAGRY